MDMMISIGLPIGLFIITLIIILALRKADQTSRRLANVKKLVDQIKAQTEKTDSNFKQELAEIEVAISQKEDKLHELIETCTVQINTLDSYYDDFGRLGSAMQTYKNALAGVQKLTDSAKEDVESVTADVDRLEEVRQLIESFRQDMQEAEKQLIEHEKTVITLEKDSLQRMDEAAYDANARMKQAVESYINMLDGKLQETREAADDLIAKMQEMLQKPEPEPSFEPEPEPVIDSEPEPEPSFEPEPVIDSEPEPEPEPDSEEFEITDIDYDIDVNEDEEPEKKREKVEYTGEDEEIIFG